MAIAFRNKTQVNVATAASVVLTVPAAVENGDILIAALIQSDTVGSTAQTWTDPSGWTLIGNTNTVDAVNGGVGCVRTLIRVAANEPASYTWTIASTLCGGIMGAWSGVDTGTAQDATFTSAAGGVSTTTAANPAAITTVTDNAWVLSFVGASTPQTSSPSNQTQRALLTGGGGGLADANKTPAGSFDPSTYSPTSVWSTHTIALRPATGLNFLASASGIADASGTTADCSTALNVQAGDLLVGFLCNESTVASYAIAATTGAANSHTFDAGDKTGDGTDVVGSFGYVLSATANSTATFRGTFGTAVINKTILVMQFRPVAGATVSKDGSNGTDTHVSGTAVVSGNITTTGTDEVALGASDLFNTAITSAEQINSVNADRVLRQTRASIWYRILTATFTGGQATATYGTADSRLGCIIAFKSVGSAAAPVWILRSVFRPAIKGPQARAFHHLQKRYPPGLTGPQTYVSDLAGGLSFVGVFTKATSRSLTGGLSFVGAFTKLTITTRTGGLSFSGAFTKRTNKSLTGGLSFVGALNRFVSKGLTASLTFVGALTKFTSRSLTGSLSFSGAFVKTIAKAFTGGLSFSGAISRLIRKSLTGSLSFSGALSKFISKGMTASLSFVGGLTKLTIKGTFTASLSFIGTFATVLLKVVSFTASLSFSGAFSKQTNKSLAGSLSFVGAISKFTSKSLSATLSFVGALTRLTSKGLAASLNFSGALAKTTKAVRTASLSFIGALSKQTNKQQAATLSFVGAVNRLTSKGLTGALSFSGAVAKQIRKVLTGGLSFSGLLTALKNGGGQLYTQALTASLSFSGSVAKLTKRGFTASLGLAGTGIGPTIAIVSGRIAKRLKGILYEDIDN